MKAHKSAKWWLAICNTLKQVDIANFSSALQYYHRFTQIFNGFEVMSYIYAKTHNPIYPCKMLFSFLITYFETYRKRCSVITQFHVMFISIRRCTSITWFQKSICVDSQSWLILGRNILSMVNVFQCSFEHCFMWIRRKRNEKKAKIQIRRVFIFYCFCISRFTCQITLFFVKPGFAHIMMSLLYLS